jgi:tetratricopeptide (TPR) repeat protein
MMTALMLLAQAAPAPVPADPQRYRACAAVAEADGAKGVAAADAWAKEGGGFLADRCKGLALATGGQWAQAAAIFEFAAQGAQSARHSVAYPAWAQAGNAWLAAGQPTRAKAALDNAIDPGFLRDLQLGQAHIDRARAFVGMGELPSARTDLDIAVREAPEDPLGWLLSATLARRMGDLERARDDIVEAAERDADNPAVQLEVGNIAAGLGEDVGARGAWARVIELAPESPQAASAKAALAANPAQ